MIVVPEVPSVSLTVSIKCCSDIVETETDTEDTRGTTGTTFTAAHHRNSNEHQDTKDTRGTAGTTVTAAPHRNS